MNLALILVIAAPLFACSAIEADQITGKDLAAASPIFAAIDPGVIVSPAPVPGAQRFLHPAELLGLAKRNGIAVSGPIAEACFERATELLSAEKLLPVLQAALGIDQAAIEILDFSRIAVPHGSLEFARAGLASNGLWRGHVNFGENRSTPVWVRVRVIAAQTWVEAAAPLAPGKPIEIAQLKIGRGPRSPLGPAPLASLDAVAGQTVVRPVKPGEPIFANMLIAPREVERGDTVKVEVQSGAAHLSFDAVSQTPARAGELVLLRNPDSGRYFQARVVAKDKAQINK